MQARTIKTWHLVHKWTSLVCTLFLLMLCITGLPIIFYEEIDHASGNVPDLPVLEGVSSSAGMDKIVAAAQRLYPQEQVKYLIWDDHEPNLVYTSMQGPDSAPDEFRVLAFDGRTGDLLQEPNYNSGFMYVMFTLHVDMFAALPGMLFLGFMGLLFVASIASGTVLYAPFMRKLTFGTVRHDRAPRAKWLDLHNLLGVVTLAWVLVVGTTGVINTLADLVLALWRADQLAEMTAPYQGKPPLEQLGSLDQALVTAFAAAPHMTPSFVAFPGTDFSTNHHYMVAMYGNTPLTSKLMRPVLVDAETNALTAVRELPWYVKTLLISQPLHFGDYGGMPLKIIWAVFDLVTIIVLGSGLYLWLARRRSSIEVEIAELERAEARFAAE
ncbi:MAG: peptidase [Rhodospirillum sp.]|nr:peptidase [Rhodospirillum sp.]